MLHFERTGSAGFEPRKFVVPEIVFGVGALQLAGRFAHNLGARRVLLVTDPGVIAAGWAGEVLASLEADAVASVTFSGVSPNPRAEEVARGAETFLREGCDVLVAVGGGSAIDCAKGIGIVASNGRPILEFAGIDRIEAPIPPLVCVPTTGGTSADVSQFAIITDPCERTKVSIVSKAMVPDVALIDPRTLITMDRHLGACTGMDALAHAFEAFVSNAHSPLTDLHALQAVRLLSQHLLPSLESPQDLELRSQVMLGALEAGLAFSNASLGATHAMAHSLGGLADLAHGECNAMLLPHVVAYNYGAAPERFSELGEAMGLQLRGVPESKRLAALRAELERIRRAAGLQGGMSGRGIHRTDVPILTEHAMVDACLATNPRQPRRRDIEVVYEEAL